jgi:hypothetical protein
LRGTVPVALAPADAMALFTPSGERAWAHGWDPSFPVATEDETAPGTVFSTGEAVTWVVASRDADRRVRYALVEPGRRAGTVEVACAVAADGTTIATVIYDMTALSAAGEEWLTGFAAEYDAFLEHWRAAIAAALGRDSGQAAR